MFIGVSAPNVLDGDDVATMADRSIVFALANPEPEVDPAEAPQHAAVVATGRSDFPNQINNVLAFPGVFRGLLDARSRRDHAAMLLAAARALAGVVTDDELNAAYIMPSVFHADVHTRRRRRRPPGRRRPAELPTDTEVAASNEVMTRIRSAEANEPSASSRGRAVAGRRGRHRGAGCSCAGSTG